MALELEHTFDKNTYRHAYNGHIMVMHCHHYMSLLTRLAMEYADVNGPDILAEAAEDSIRPLLEESARRQSITTPEAILTLGRELYQQLGMGLMAINGTGETGEVTLVRSHVDQGWMKKWGKATTTINHFTRGFIAAIYGAAFGKSGRAYAVQETASIARGDATTTFVVKPK